MRFIEAVSTYAEVPTTAPEHLREVTQLKNERWAFTAGVEIAEAGKRLYDEFHQWRSSFERRVLIGEEGWWREILQWSGREETNLIPEVEVSPELCLRLAVGMDNIREHLLQNPFDGSSLTPDRGTTLQGFERTVHERDLTITFCGSDGVRINETLLGPGESVDIHVAGGNPRLAALFPYAAAVTVGTTPISAAWASVCDRLARLFLAANRHDSSVRLLWT